MSKGIIIGGSILATLSVVLFVVVKRRNTPRLEAYDNIKKTVSYQYKGKNYNAEKLTIDPINIGRAKDAYGKEFGPGTGWALTPITDSKSGTAIVVGVKLTKDGVTKEQMPLSTI